MIDTDTQTEVMPLLAYDGMAGLIHDLGNYIQIATSAVTIMSRHADVRASEGLFSIVAHAADSLERAGALVRRSAGQPDVAEEHIGIDDCLTQLGPLLHYACGPNIRVKLLVGMVPKIRCSRLGLQNALLNLAINARDAMPAGGAVTISALLAEGPETPEVVITITDTGLGMPPAILTRAFEPHFSTKPARAGHGMGLAGVKSFVERSGGRVLIQSTVGIGTSVTVRLPATA